MRARARRTQVSNRWKECDVVVTTKCCGGEGGEGGRDDETDNNVIVYACVIKVILFGFFPDYTYTRCHLSNECRATRSPFLPVRRNGGRASAGTGSRAPSTRLPGSPITRAFRICNHAYAKPPPTRSVFAQNVGSIYITVSASGRGR